jgi:hypothetical protein
MTKDRIELRGQGPLALVNRFPSPQTSREHGDMFGSVKGESVLGVLFSSRGGRHDTDNRASGPSANPSSGSWD